MSSPTERLNALTDKNGRRLQPLLEDMRLRENAVIICSFGGDDPFAPISRHLAEDHETQIAAGLDLLAEVCGCTDIIIYAAQLDLNVLADRLSGRYNITVKTGVSSPVLREPTALYSVIDTGVIRAGNAEEEYKKTFPSYGYRGRPTLSVDAETVYQAYRLARSLGMTKHAAVIGKETVISEAGIGAPVLVLETVGRRSGRRRRTPILYLERGEQLIVLAANGGSDRVPAWWLNLRAAGGGRVTLHGTTWAVTPRVLDGDEYERTWAAFARMYPAIDEYRTFTERDLPLVALHPSTGGV